MPDYFTLEEFRELPDMNDEGKYSDALIERAAGYIEAIIERVVGTSFVPRTVTEALDGRSTTEVVLSSPYIRSVTSVSRNGSTVDVNGLSTKAGVLRYLTGGTTWTTGVGNISVTYQSGYSDEPPPDIKEAAMQATRARTLSTAEGATIDDRTTQMSNADGGTTTFVLPGVERPTGYPEVDAVILGWRDKLSGFGFA